MYVCYCVLKLNLLLILANSFHCCYKHFTQVSDGISPINRSLGHLTSFLSSGSTPRSQHSATIFASHTVNDARRSNKHLLDDSSLFTNAPVTSKEGTYLVIRYDKLLHFLLGIYSNNCTNAYLI